MHYLRALAVSLIIHAILSWLFILFVVKSEGSGDKQGDGSKGSAVGDFLSKKLEPIKIRITSTKKGINTPTPPPAPLPKEDEECKSHYFGLGYYPETVSETWCTVGKVAPGSPLDRLGVVTGDRIQRESDGCPGQGLEGTEVTILLFRKSGSIETLTIKRDKICTMD